MAGEKGPIEQKLKLLIGVVPDNTTFVVFFESLEENLPLTSKIFIDRFNTIGDMKLFINMINVFSYCFRADE